MATPSRNDSMVKHLMRMKTQKEKKEGANLKCQRQFPDCPPEPNDSNCSSCPFYKK